MNNLNNILSVLILIILLPFIFRFEMKELFSNTIISEEVIDEENQLRSDFSIENEPSDKSYLNLAPTVNYMSHYKDVINENGNVMDNSVKNLIEGRNDVFLEGKPMSSFDSLNFNRAFIDSLKMQSLDDRYIYKLNQKLK
jgi:hypothetical protein